MHLLRPTLPTLVASYVAVGITKRAAVRYIVDSRMLANTSHGHGNRARRRSQLIARFGTPVRFPARPADVTAERFSEGRTFDRTARVNPHD